MQETSNMNTLYENIMKAKDTVREQAILLHLTYMSERNSQVMTEIEERWEEVCAAFSFSGRLFYHNKKFYEIYSPIWSFIEEQRILSSVDDFGQARERFHQLADITEKIDNSIAQLFTFMTQVETEFFRRIAKSGEC